MSGSGEQLVPNTVGIRHLSPAGAFHLARILEEVQPSAVVVEAPAGAEQVMEPLLHPDTQPPVALLAFTKQRPVRTFVLPLAAYSPEWIAGRWALAHHRELIFMDLPPEVFLGLAAEEHDTPPCEHSAEPAPACSPLEEIARISGAPDLETWWERTFEHTTEARAYVEAAFALGVGLRAVGSAPLDRETRLREAFMRRTLRRVLKDHAPEKVVVVCGAFHAPVLTAGEPELSQSELEALPRAEAVLTLIPYSYARLHERSGYGAGNHAPRYYQSLHAELLKGKPQRLAARVLTQVARQMRRQGVVRSSAQVIDAVRLAYALAAMAESPAVTLRDLRDAAYTCLGAGERAPVAEALEAVETGTAIGRLPAGVSRTALQDDFRHQVARLKLDQYLGEKEQLVELDLREDRFAKSEAAARLDQERSVFLQQLLALEVPLAHEDARGRQSLTSWKESWLLHWSPEAELKLAELSLVGESIAGAAGFVLSERLGACRGAGEAAEVLRDSARCHIADSLDRARARVQEAATLDDDLLSVATAVSRLLEVVRFGGVRAVDPEPLWPLVAQLFLRAALLIPNAVRCDDTGCEAGRFALAQLATAASQEPARLPVDALEAKLREVALGDAGHPHLVGVATALLLERGKITDEESTAAIGRRLKPGEAPDAVGAFFEGLAAHNRMALFARRSVWEALSRFVDELDGTGLLCALAPLRRAFGGFAPGEVRRVVSALGEVWGGSTQLAREVERPIPEAELDALKDKLGDLGDLDL